jgi:hypothetical protein
MRVPARRVCQSGTADLLSDQGDLIRRLRAERVVAPRPQPREETPLSVACLLASTGNQPSALDLVTGSGEET